MKFTQDGEVALRIIVESLADDTITLRVSIVDTGIGISKESQKHLFHRFQQADGSTTRKFGGTGLGLAISKEIVDVMDGDIGLTSAEGEGATFWFNVPLAFEPGVVPPKKISHDVNVTLVYRNKTGRECIAGFIWGDL
ncbi:ATP-binding protein [Marinomonas primoryensis]|nr:ATP-binding protein [Marinomonas primoryensis]